MGWDGQEDSAVVGPVSMRLLTVSAGRAGLSCLPQRRALGSRGAVEAVCGGSGAGTRLLPKTLLRREEGRQMGREERRRTILPKPDGLHWLTWILHLPRQA